MSGHRPFHLTVLDINGLRLITRAGEVSGLQSSATPRPTRCTKKEIVIDYNRAPIIQNFVAVFRKVVGYTGSFRIKITDHEHKHVGLGWTSTVMIAVATAMNEAVGCRSPPRTPPPDRAQLRGGNNGRKDRLRF